MKQVLALLLVCFGGSLLLPAQDLQTMLSRADSTEKAMKDQQAYQQYLTILDAYPTNPIALCKASLLADRLGNRLHNKEARHGYYKKAHQLATKAVQLYPQSADAHFTVSVSLGRVALMSSGKVLVESVKKIKYHADKAIQLDPADFRAYHVLGRWYYEIANLGAFKRAAVKVFFGAFPEASFELSASAYEKSRQLNPAFILTYLELAKVYYELDQKSKAVDYLKKLQQLPPTIEDDKRIKEEGSKLLKKWTA